MQNAFVGSLSMIDTSGRIIIATILSLLATSVGTTWVVRSRYRRLENELREHMDSGEPLAAGVLNRIVEDARHAAQQPSGPINAQAIVEHRFQSELRGLIVGERFVKAAVSLSIILGLVGTFYGLTSAIGRLVGLVSADSPGVADVTQAVTRGLSQALTGMSVAFSSSLFGIMAAIVMTLVGVFFNVADRRTRTMVAMEAYLDNVFLGSALADQRQRTPGAIGLPLGGRGAENLAPVMGDFAQAVANLQGVVQRFDAALERFANNTRDFQEFNLHLKDNIQRMSVSFGDLSETVKKQVKVLKSQL